MLACHRLPARCTPSATRRATRAVGLRWVDPARTHPPATSGAPNAVSARHDPDRTEDGLPDLLEPRQPRARRLVHVQAALDLDHEGAHAEIFPVEAHRHERAGERSVDRHAPTQLLECAHRGVAQPIGRVARVGPDADVRAVRVLVVLVGQRTRREGCARRSRGRSRARRARSRPPSQERHDGARRIAQAGSDARRRREGGEQDDRWRSACRWRPCPFPPWVRMRRRRIAPDRRRHGSRETRRWSPGSRGARTARRCSGRSSRGARARAARASGASSRRRRPARRARRGECEPRRREGPGDSRGAPRRVGVRHDGAKDRGERLRGRGKGPARAARLRVLHGERDVVHDRVAPDRNDHQPRGLVVCPDGPPAWLAEERAPLRPGPDGAPGAAMAKLGGAVVVVRVPQGIARFAPAPLYTFAPVVRVEERSAQGKTRAAQRMAK